MLQLHRAFNSTEKLSANSSEAMTPLQVLHLASLFLSLTLSNPFPLSTTGRWITDAATGRRVKLACVNWPAHTQGMVAQGLHRRPLAAIAATVARLRFNCVRLTYCTHMFTRYANSTVAESFGSLDLKDAMAGIAMNNPSFLNKTVVEAYEAVVDSLAAVGVMVVSDNHISQPRWCCAEDDGNGFFGDRYFDPQEWLRGLELAALLLKNKPHVVAMSLRNELRGANQSVEKWHHYMTQGAALIHQTNPATLIILSGLSFDTDLSFLHNTSLGLDLDRKLVFEAHLYSFSNGMGNSWTSKPLNQLCTKTNQGYEDRAGFVARGANPVPVIVSEFGVDQTGRNEGQNRFLSCFFSYLVGNDFDWGLWGLQGSYYYREGVVNDEEFFGVLDSNWTQLRNPKFFQKFHLLQMKLQDPSSNLSISFLMYHPRSGQCMRLSKRFGFRLGSCQTSNRWSHDEDGSPIRLAGGDLCLRTAGVGLPPVLSRECLGQQNVWKYASNDKLQLSAVDENGQYLCLEKESHSLGIVTKKCRCLDESPCQGNPQSQWFQLVPSNVYPI